MNEEHKKTKKHLEHWKVVTLFLMGYDFLAILVSYFGALWIRFDCRYQSIPREYLQMYARSIFVYAAVCIVIFWIAHLYRSIWRFASYSELLRVTFSTVVTACGYFLVMIVTRQRMPLSYYVSGIFLQFVTTLGIRFSYRFVLLLRGRRNQDMPVKRVMLIGAGAAGQMIFRDIKSAKETSEKVYCFIDDIPNKWERYIDGVIVYGGRERILEACEKYGIEKIYVAIPSAAAEDKREILQICNETDCLN